MKRFALIALATFILVACGGQPAAVTQTEQVEVTRLVEVEVEVTRLIETEVEVTRLVETVITATPPPTPPPTATREIDPTNYIAASNMSIEEIPQGEAGLVVVVAGPPSTFGVLPIVIRNNTDSPVYDIKLSATARDASGAVVGTANGDDITPSYVPPGGLAVGRVPFGDTSLDGASIDYNITGNDDPGSIFARRDLEILEHQLVAGNVAGLALNNHAAALDLTKLIVMCFDDNSLPTDVNFSYTDQESVESGGELPFSVDLLGDEARCGRYLIAGSGREMD